MPSGREEARRRVVVVGGGTVGSHVVSLLRDRSGVQVTGVLVRDRAKQREFDGWRDLVTDDPEVALEADLLVEVAGGLGAPAELALAALGRGVPLVTANKAALAERWDEFAPHIATGRVWFEAAVMAGAPVVGALTGALRGCGPTSLHAVLNGTCNVILSEMENGLPYEQALAGAQAAGFAEADPTLDVEGIDAAHKVSLLARLAFDPRLDFAAVRAATRGVTGLDPELVREHAGRGRSVRLVASVVPDGEAWSASVRPLSLPAGHPLVADGPTNALVFSGDPLGDVVIRGPGAGGGPTATAVVSDVIAALAGGRGHEPLEHRAAPPRAGDGSGTDLPEGAEVLAA